MTMKVSTTNDNRGNDIARNLMAPILFYLKVHGQLLWSEQRKMLWTWLQWVHQVHYDPANADLQRKYKIYWSPFDTGSVEHWLKFLSKLNLMITKNGLMVGLAKFNLMQLLLRGEWSLQHFNNKAKELGNETNVHHKQCLNVVSAPIFPKNALQMQKYYLLSKVHFCSSVTCKVRSTSAVQQPLVSTLCASINKWPTWLSSTKDQGWWNNQTDIQTASKLHEEQSQMHEQPWHQQCGHGTVLQGPQMSQTLLSVGKEIGEIQEVRHFKKDSAKHNGKDSGSVPILLTTWYLLQSHVCFMVLALTPQKNVRWWRNKQKGWRWCKRHKLPSSAPRNARNGRLRRLPLMMNLRKWWLKVSRSLWRKSSRLTWKLLESAAMRIPIVGCPWSVFLVYGAWNLCHIK